MSEGSDQISRRSLIIGASAVTTGALLSAVAEAQEPAARTNARDVRWDHETDIVCIGGGAAGLTAAVTAHGNGDQVIVIESEAMTGGTTAKSGGVFWIPNNIHLRQNGIMDKRAEALEYMARFSYSNEFVSGHPTLGISPESYALICAYYDNGSIMVDRLIEIGITSKVQPWTLPDLGRAMRPNTTPLAQWTPDYLSQAPENKVKTGRAIVVSRSDGSPGSGADLIEQLETFLFSRKQPVLTSHRARELILNQAGEVVGLAAENAGKLVYIRAKKAVIFGSGGFAHNKKLVHQFHKTNIFGACAGNGSHGDIIPIATKAGAALGNMPNAWRGNVVIEQAVRNAVFSSILFMPLGDSMIFVNKYGRRFVDEYRSYSSRAKAFDVYDPTEEEYPNHVAVMICDQRTIDIYGGSEYLPLPGKQSPWIVSAQSIEDLAVKVRERLDKVRSHGISTRLSEGFVPQLKNTIARYNGFATSGIDEDFGRGKYDFDKEIFNSYSLPRDNKVIEENEFLQNRTMYPIAQKGPYYAMLVGMGSLDTNGGPVINAEGQIVDYNYRPIPGLYGAGNCIASPTGEAYYGPGGTIGPAMTFGFIAANNAHRELQKKV